MCKDIFIDEHEQSNIMKDHKNFFIKIEKFKPYMIEFEKNKIIKSNVYLSDYAIKRDEYQLIIIITNNKYIFFANNEV